MRLSILFFFLLSAARPGIAQSPTTRDTVPPDDSLVLRREVIITAQRQRHDRFTLPVSATVLDRDYLIKRAPRSVPEALFGVPGVFLQKTNHGGGSPFMRGLTGQQTLLLVDGIRLNNATFRSGPNQYLNTLDPAWMERIEVLESSAAAEYGSDAIGGVVHVLTHTLRFSEQNNIRPEAAFKWMSGGMETSGQGALTASGRRWAMRAGGAYRHFGDLVAGKGLGKESPNGYTQWSAEAKGLFQLSRRFTLTAAYQDLEQQDVPVFHKVQLENFKYNSFDPQRRQLAYARLQGVFENKWWQKTELTVSRQRSLEGRISQKNGNPIQVTETDETRTNGLQFNVLSNISQNWQMTTGVEWYADAVRSDKVERNENTHASVMKRGLYPDRSSMQSGAAYNLHTLTWRRLTLTGGLRFNTFRIRVPDENIGVSIVKPSALVGNLGASWEFVPGLRGYANAATAFRAPNVDDLGTLGIVDFRYELPNYQLSPEKSRGIEAGLKIRHGGLSGSVSAYHLQLDDLIGRIRTADSLQGYPVYRKENITEAYIRGVEIQAGWSFLQRWSIGGHATYTFGQNTSAKEPLRRIPPLNGRAYVQFSLASKIDLRAETVFADAQRRLAKGDIDDNRIADDGTPGWQIFNLGAFYQLNIFTLSGELHNIANKAYRTHGSGVDGVGRSVWVRMGMSF